jgi:hypothetical protein
VIVADPCRYPRPNTTGPTIQNGCRGQRSKQAMCHKLEIYALDAGATRPGAVSRWPGITGKTRYDVLCRQNIHLVTLVQDEIRSPATLIDKQWNHIDLDVVAALGHAPSQCRLLWERRARDSPQSRQQTAQSSELGSAPRRRTSRYAWRRARTARSPPRNNDFLLRVLEVAVKLAVQ